MDHRPDSILSIVPNAQPGPTTETVSSRAAASSQTRGSLQLFGSTPPGRLAPLGLADYPVESITQSSVRAA